jgi:PadR family transcriptional regulator, regulatory protein AphA
MSAKHAVLGLVADKPAYPYEVGERLQWRLGPGWLINSGQLYQTIKRLTREGLIKRVDGSVGGRDDRHVFGITERGLEEFERWRNAPTDGARPLRRPVLVKLMFAGPEYRTQTLEDIDAYERACTERLKQLVREQEEIPPEGSRVRADHVVLRLALNAEVVHWESELGWSREARETFKWLYDQDDVIWPSPTRRLSRQAETTPNSQDARDELFGRIAKHSRSTLDHQQRKRRS